jgi:Cytochrome c7 and related cytochrome c
MKIRTACLAALPALALPLLSCMGSPPPGAKAQVALATGAAWSPIGKATFPHEKHATEFEVECAKCHHETNAKPLTIPHMEYFSDLWINCGTCHHKAGAEALGPQACSTCHHAKNGDIADETLSAKVVIHKNCWSCHEVGTGAAASAACKTCHPARS